MGGEIMKAGGVPPGYLFVESRLKHLEKRLHQAGEDGRADQYRTLKEVAAEFESLFIYYILQRMRATVPRSGFLSGSHQQEVYTSMLDQELARHLAARGGIGLSALLLEQLAGNSR